HLGAGGGVAVGDHERGDRVDAVHAEDVVVVAVLAGGAEHHHVDGGRAVAAAADAVDGLLERGVDVRAAAGQVNDRPVQRGRHVGAVADLEALQRRVQGKRGQKQGAKKGRAEWPALEGEMATDQNRTLAPARKMRGLWSCSIQLFRSLSPPFAEYIRLSRQSTVRSLVALNRSRARLTTTPC